MSKLDAQRAMREARYARQAASRKGTAPTRRSPAAPPRETELRVAPDGDAAPTTDVCGHRSMNGRTCTRPAGHAEKNHRYG